MKDFFIQYEHHGTMVWSRSDLVGKHRERCLCYSCEHFKPNTEENCEKAQRLYKLNVEEDMVTPVFECPIFAQLPDGDDGVN